MTHFVNFIFVFWLTGYRSPSGPSKQRRVLAVAGKIVTALKVYCDRSLSIANELSLELADIGHYPRMLTVMKYHRTLPVDPVAEKEGWIASRSKLNQVVGDSPCQSNHQRFTRRFCHFTARPSIQIGNLWRSRYHRGTKIPAICWSSSKWTWLVGQGRVVVLKNRSCSLRD